VITEFKAANTGLLIILLMLLTLVGFYPTYISKFPAFENVTNVHHFHGAMMMAWYSLLLTQPFLIGYKKYKLHRTLGKVSYVIAPLLLYSIYLAGKHEYYGEITFRTNDESVAGLAVDFSSLVAFAVCYMLAVLNVKNPAIHARYMVGTALIIMAPGLMRIIAVYRTFGDIDFPTVVLYSYLICAAIAVWLMTYDLVKSKPYKPYMVATILIIAIYVTYVSRMTDWWLAIGGAITKMF
jgi:hypothetical protein